MPRVTCFEVDRESAKGREKRVFFDAASSRDDGCTSLVLVVGRRRRRLWLMSEPTNVNNRYRSQGLILCSNTVLEWIPISRSFFSRSSFRLALIPALRMTQRSRPMTVTLALGIGESARLSSSVHLWSLDFSSFPCWYSSGKQDGTSWIKA